jgi:hypothetical protein
MRYFSSLPHSEIGISTKMLADDSVLERWCERCSTTPTQATWSTPFPKVPLCSPSLLSVSFCLPTTRTTQCSTGGRPAGTTELQGVPPEDGRLPHGQLRAHARRVPVYARGDGRGCQVPAGG